MGRGVDPCGRPVGEVSLWENCRLEPAPPADAEPSGQASLRAADRGAVLRFAGNHSRQGTGVDAGAHAIDRLLMVKSATPVYARVCKLFATCSRTCGTPPRSFGAMRWELSHSRASIRISSLFQILRLPRASCYQILLVRVVCGIAPGDSLDMRR